MPRWPTSSSTWPRSPRKYDQLLEQLAALPSHPRVLINLYYGPFDRRQQCLTSEGLDAAKEQALSGLWAGWVEL